MVSKESQAIIIAFIMLSLALVYVGYQVYALQMQLAEQAENINELRGLLLKIEVTIDNGNATKTEVIWLTKGASALEALRRMAVVETKYFSGLGEFIESIDGIRNDPEMGKYWMWYIWNEEKAEWEYATVGAGSYKLRGGERIMFRYEVPVW